MLARSARVRASWTTAAAKWSAPPPHDLELSSDCQRCVQLPRRAHVGLFSAYRSELPLPLAWPRFRETDIEFCDLNLSRLHLCIARPWQRSPPL